MYIFREIHIISPSHSRLHNKTMPEREIKILVHGHLNERVTSARNFNFGMFGVGVSKILPYVVSSHSGIFDTRAT